MHINVLDGYFDNSSNYYKCKRRGLCVCVRAGVYRLCGRTSISVAYMLLSELQVVCLKKNVLKINLAISNARIVWTLLGRTAELMVFYLLRYGFFDPELTFATSHLNISCPKTGLLPVELIILEYYVAFKWISDGTRLMWFQIDCWSEKSSWDDYTSANYILSGLYTEFLPDFSRCSSSYCLLHQMTSSPVLSE